MYKFILSLFIIILMLILLPYLVINNNFFGEEKESTIFLNVYNHQEDRLMEMEFAEYLKGVVAAEMPVLYDMEALKAQAVAARTYALKQISNPPNSIFPAGTDISTDFRYHQAWISQEEMKDKWGFLPYFYFYLRIVRAVEETSGEILTYNGQLIDAVYHSNSGGQTSAAEDVWSEPRPYLVSVISPYDYLRERNFHHKFEFDIDHIKNKLQLSTITSKNEIDITVLHYTESGRVAEIKIEDQIFSGEKIRTLLSLPSSKFDFTIKNNKLICEVIGFGHGVGMSQDGADGFAKKGYNYQEILAHYYPQTEIVNYFE